MSQVIARQVYSIIMAERSVETLIDLFRTKKVATLADLQEVLGCASRATTFRYLKRVNYLRSYNHNGRYYTGRDAARFDRCGLYSVGDIHFSRDGTLGETLKRLVQESQAGWTQRALQELLRVRVQVLLLDAVRHDAIRREQVAGFYLYLHKDQAIGDGQLQRRLAQIAVRPPMDGAQIDVSDKVIIQVLLTLIRHPGSRPADVVRSLRGYSPPIVLEQVVAIFTRYDLEDVDKKRGAMNY